MGYTSDKLEHIIATTMERLIGDSYAVLSSHRGGGPASVRRRRRLDVKKLEKYNLLLRELQGDDE